MSRWAVPTVENFLCCFSLQNGVKVYGWMFLVGHMMFSMEAPFRSSYLYFNCNYIFEDPDTGSHECPNWLYTELLIRALVETTLVLLEIGTSFLLLLGAYQKIRRFILQWIIIQFALLICDVLFTLAMKFVFVLHHYTSIYHSMFYISWKCAEVYGIFIGYSYYQTMSSLPQMVV